MRITVVIPVCNEAPTLAPLAEGILQHRAGHTVQIVFVDDGSTDGSWPAIVDLAARLPEVEGIRLRRNCGKGVALRAGIARADGDAVITMDGDLQDDPAEIPNLLAKLEEGNDLVGGWKARRHDPWHKTLPSRLYNGWLRWMFGLPTHDINTGFKAMRGELARRVPLDGGLYRLIPVFAQHWGYRVAEVPVRHHRRQYGQSKFGFTRIFRGAADALAVRAHLRQGDQDLAWARFGPKVEDVVAATTGR
jgi:glycosyltransferase involved in cell wall biosynthesis